MLANKVDMKTCQYFTLTHGVNANIPAFKSQSNLMTPSNFARIDSYPHSARPCHSVIA